MNVDNAVAVITGAGSGIGRAAASRLAAAGARLVLADIAEEPLAETAGLVRAAGGACQTRVVDVTKEAETEALMQLAVAHYGALNILLPCAGVIRDGFLVRTDRETGKVSGKMSLADWRAVIEVNLTGTFLCVRDAAAAMIDSGSQGVLFVISSVNKAGQLGQLNYAASKAADALFPKIITGEFNRRRIRGIRVVGIAPGYVATPMVQAMKPEVLDEQILPDVHLGRLIEPAEIVELVCQVCQNEAIDGTTIEITGGLCHHKGIAK
jgi:3-oxoacyl-[acyl-carrier protein] reductase